MIEVKNTSPERTSEIAYASDEVYVVTRDNMGFSAGDEVRLVGESPHTVGTHPINPGDYVMVMRADLQTAEWIGVLKTQLDPQPE